jgi:hypothetical protein
MGQDKRIDYWNMPEIEDGTTLTVPSFGIYNLTDATWIFYWTPVMGDLSFSYSENKIVLEGYCMLKTSLDTNYKSIKIYHGIFNTLNSNITREKIDVDFWSKDLALVNLATISNFKESIQKPDIDPQTWETLVSFIGDLTISSLVFGGEFRDEYLKLGKIIEEYGHGEIGSVYEIGLLSLYNIGELSKFPSASPY